MTIAGLTLEVGMDGVRLFFQIALRIGSIAFELARWVRYGQLCTHENSTNACHPGRESSPMILRVVFL